MTLNATTPLQGSDINFEVLDNSHWEIFTVESTPKGRVKLSLTGKTGNGKFVVKASERNGLSSTKAYDIHIGKDGVGNIASYHGNSASRSSNENQSSIFYASNVLDDDASTRWLSAPADTA